MTDRSLKLNATPGTITLNHDVLTSIVQSIGNRTDLFQIMRTCRFLYDAGVQPLVKDRAGMLSHRDLRSFHEFMVNHAPVSFEAFRRLNLFLSHPSSVDDSIRVKDLLERGKTHLEILYLPPDNTSAVHENILQPLASLRNLRYFSSIDFAPELREYVLPRLKSPLTEILLCLEDDEDPFPLLANFTSTLQEANIAGIFASSAPSCFPKLTTLYLTSPSPPNLSLIAPAFPNVEELHVRDEVYETDAAFLEASRKANVEFQRGHSCWPSLNSVEIRPNALHAMGLHTTKVESLEIRWIDIGMGSEDMPWFLFSLEGMRPEHLIIALVDDDALVECFSRGCDDLIELDLTVLFLRGEDFEEALVSLYIDE